jgi:hypothetical protein
MPVQQAFSTEFPGFDVGNSENSKASMWSRIISIQITPSRHALNLEH